MKRLSKWLSFLIQFIIGGVFGAVIGILVIPLIKEQIFDLSLIIFCLISFITAYFIHIIIHESGHLLFGLLTGYSFISFRIGRFIWLKEDRHIVLKRFSLAGTTGQCLLAPPPYNNNQYPIFLYNLGGCLLNIIISFISIIVYFILEETFLSLFFIIVALYGIMLAFINGIPLCLTSIDNDGCNALQTYRNSTAKKAFWIILKINELNTHNIRLKDMDDSLFLNLSAKEVNTHLASSLLIINIQRAIDQKDFLKAQSLINYIYDNDILFTEIHWNMLINDHIFCSLIMLNFNDLENLYTRDFKQFIKVMKKTPAIIRTQYTYELLYHKDENKAQEHLHLFDEVSKTYPYLSEIESEKELIDYAYSLYQKKPLE